MGSEWSTAALAGPKNWALSASQATDFLANDAVLFDDRAVMTTVSIAANVNPNIVSFNNSTQNFILQGVAGIATGSLTKAGAGILTIANANTYSGGTTLYEGGLKVGTDGALGSGPLTLRGGTLSSNSATARSLSNAVFVQGNITLGDPATAGKLNFSGSVDLGAATRELAIASDVVVAGVVANGGLIKAGSGTLTLSGANTYAGGTVLTAGTLAVTSPGSLGDASGALTFAGNSTMLYNASYQILRNFSIATGVFATLDSNGFSLTQTSVISGDGGLIKAGAGTFTLAGINLYTGGTTVSGGTLAVSGGSAIPDTGVVSLANTPGVTLLLNASETIGALTGGGAAGGSVNLQSHTLTVGNALTRNYAGVISGSGSLTKSNTGTLTLAGNNIYSGITTISAGTLSISADNGLGMNPVSATPGKLVLSGGTLATAATLALNSNRGLTTGGTIDVAAGTTLSYGGIAAGNGALTKTGNGTFILSGANSYTGATNVSAGNLAVNGSLDLGSTVTIAGDATLSGTGTVGGSVIAGENAIITAGNGTSGSLTIGGSLTFVGDGLIQIGNLSNYTGSTAINLVGSLVSLDAASIIFLLPSGVVSNGSYRLLSHSNNLNVNAFKAYSVTGPTIGGRQLAKLDDVSGRIDYVVSGDTPYWTGSAGSAWNTTATSWKLVSAGTDTLFIAGDAVLFNDAATGTTTVDIPVNVNPAVVAFANSNKDYVVQGVAGISTGSVSKSGTGSLTFTNANSYNEGTILSGGSLKIGNNNALGTGIVTLNGGTLSSDSSTARTLTNSIGIGGDITLGNATQNGLLTLSGAVDLGGSVRQISAASNVTLAGVLTNGGLTKSGVGTLTLTGTNSYTGATSVIQGKLVVNGALASATTTVGSGAILGGSGTIAGATTIQSGGVHAPGNSPGLQAFTDLTYADGSFYSWEIDRNSAQTRGIGYDAVNVSGTLAGLDGADANTTTDAIFRIVIGDSDFSNSFWNTPKTWTDIFTGADGSTAKVDWASIFGGGFQFYNTGGNAIAAPVSGNFTLTGNSLTWSAVPEPTSALAGLLLAAGLMRRRR